MTTSKKNILSVKSLHVNIQMNMLPQSTTGTLRSVMFSVLQLLLLCANVIS